MKYWRNGINFGKIEDYEFLELQKALKKIKEINKCNYIILMIIKYIFMILLSPFIFILSCILVISFMLCTIALFPIKIYFDYFYN